MPDGVPSIQLNRKGRARPSQDCCLIFSRICLTVFEICITIVNSTYGNCAPSQQAMEVYPRSSLRLCTNMRGSPTGGMDDGRWEMGWSQQFGCMGLSVQTRNNLAPAANRQLKKLDYFWIAVSTLSIHRQLYP